MVIAKMETPPDDAAYAAVRAAFEEDRRVLEAVQVGFSNQATPHIDLGIDRAPLLFRRALAVRVVARAQAPSPAPVPRWVSVSVLPSAATRSR